MTVRRLVRGLGWAWFTLWTCGCGSDPDTTSTGGAGGSSSTAGGGGAAGATSTSARPGARVLVHDPSGRPAAGVDVVVHGASGAALSTHTTNADGVAEIDLLEGGGVSVLWREADTGDEPDHRAVSVLGLSADAEVRIVAEPHADHGPQPFMTLEFTGVPPLSGPDWNVEVSCRDDTMLGEQSFQYRGCPGSDTFDVFVHFQPGWDQWQVFPAQPVTPGADLPFELDLAQAEPAPEIGITATLPPEITWLGASVHAYRPEGGRNQVSRGHNPQMSPGPEITLPRVFVSEGGTYSLWITATTSLPEGVLGFTKRLLSTALPDAFDWTLPGLSPPTAAGPVSGVPSRPEVAWQLGDGFPGDAIRVELSYNVQAGASSHHTRWSVYTASESSGVVLFPELPAELSAWVPHAFASGSALVEHVDGGAGDGVLTVVNAEHDGVDTSTVWKAAPFAFE